jgi:hypothetical protein
MEAPEQVLTRGSSGARIEVRRRVVIKTGNPRVGAQGRWILEHESQALPRVLQAWMAEPAGYRMERLHDPNRDEEYGNGMFLGIIDQLQTHVWSRRPEVMLDLIFHGAKVDDLAKRFLDQRGRKRLKAGRAAVRWDRLPACLTHGDPTLDNVLLRRPVANTLAWDSIVLIDPLPATPAVPDLRCVDIGKIYQSLFGYEQIRYGDPGLGGVTLRGFLDFEKSISDDNERYASHYWHVIHLLRCFPYVDERVQRGLRVQLDEALCRL